MKKLILPFLLLIMTVNFMAQTTVDNYRQMFREKIETEKSGSSISAVFVDEKGARFVNYGTLGTDASTAQANEKTLYEIGSVTKLFVGVLLADAVKRGEVRLDAPISAYLPKNVKTPNFDGKEITLLDLATHTSGLPRLPDNLAPKNPADPYADFTAQNLYDFLSNHKLNRAPGAEYEYSNLGAGLLGHILSLRAKTSFDQLITTRIFKPLKMTDTSLALPAAKKARHAEGLNAANQPTALWFFDSLAGAGAIRSTSEDMAKFIAAAAGITKTPLAQAFAEALKPQRQGQNKIVRIGLCWNKVDFKGTEIFWHGGGTYGFSSYLAIDPKAKKGAFLANNTGKPDGAAFLESVAFNFLNSQFPIQKPKPPKTDAAVKTEILDKYLGEYELAPNFTITVTRDGAQLFIQATGQDKFEAYAETEEKFYLKVVEANFTFTKDASGKINGLIWRQEGQEIPAKKIK